MRLALKNEQFSLHYQAKWDISANRITGMEALLRWEHPELGVIAPLRFLPLAEEMGLIVPLEKWVIKTACRQNVAWQKKGLPKVSVAINLSAHQFFDPELPEYIASVLRETEMDANLLELEITESILLSRGERVVQVLNSLKEIGVRIAIDDFGVGYSSLSMLKQFPLDVIKIDRNFVRDMSTTNVDRELTQAIVAMGRKLSLTVVAQGVETKDQADFLRDNVCDQLQGFYFNKPVAAEEFTELFSRSIST
ncbi:MAG: EAL domain-containing protein [Porticoccaceae bacterium]